MSKSDKYLDIKKPSEIKRTPVDDDNKQKSKRNKKKYPPHWRIYSGLFVLPSKSFNDQDEWQFQKIGPNHYGYSEEFIKLREEFKNGNLDKVFEIYAKHHPETIDWPVRFIGCQPMETKREILS